MRGEESTPKLEELAAPAQELNDAEVENVTGGTRGQYRPKRAEIPPASSTGDPTEDPAEGFTLK